jgi:hypothetical protein
MYAYTYLSFKEFNNLDLKKNEMKLYYISDFYTIDNLYERKRYYDKGTYKGEVVVEHGAFYANLDIFYCLDMEIYLPDNGVKPIYD